MPQAPEEAFWAEGSSCSRIQSESRQPNWSEEKPNCGIRARAMSRGVALGSLHPVGHAGPCSPPTAPPPLAGSAASRRSEDQATTGARSASGTDPPWTGRSPAR